MGRSVWETKDLDIDGSNLAKIKFENMRTQIKFIWKKSSQTATKDEKDAIKKITQQFLLQYDYFGNVWKNLGFETQDKSPSLIAEGKGIISYKF